MSTRTGQRHDSSCYSWLGYGTHGLLPCEPHGSWPGHAHGPCAAMASSAHAQVQPRRQRRWQMPPLRSKEINLHNCASPGRSLKRLFPFLCAAVRVVARWPRH
nr:unnamed protein product [Digitaria exilis]